MDTTLICSPDFASLDEAQPAAVGRNTGLIQTVFAVATANDDSCVRLGMRRSGHRNHGERREPLGVVAIPGRQNEFTVV